MLRCARAALTYPWVLLCFLPIVWADTYDVSVRLYQDANCFESADDLTLLNEGCYANLWGNASKAFKVKITDFIKPQSVDVRLYSGTCHGHNEATMMRTLAAGMGRCERFPDRNSPYFGVVNLVFRGGSCPADTLCSKKLKTVQQTFYEQKLCQGRPTGFSEFPVQGECMRYFNGTQSYYLDPSGQNITQVNYAGSDKCDGNDRRTYHIVNTMCYPLYTDVAPRSFSWAIRDNSITGVKNFATAAAWRPQTTAVPGMALLIALGALILPGTVSCH